MWADVAPKSIEPQVTITRGPKKFLAECKYCKAEFSYTYTAVSSKRGGSSSRGPVTHYGLKCPSCDQWHHHRDST